MSADNGIYILPLRDAFYVAHCQGIDDLTFERGDRVYDPTSVVHRFGKARSFDSGKKAEEYARELAKDYEYLEYGICVLDRQPLSMDEFIAIWRGKMKDPEWALTDNHWVPNYLTQSSVPLESEMEEVAFLPNGCALYRKHNGVGGHTYYSDEIGGGVMVWDTCLVSEGTILAALADHHKVLYAERFKANSYSKPCEEH